MRAAVGEFLRICRQKRRLNSEYNDWIDNARPGDGKQEKYATTLRLNCKYMLAAAHSRIRLPIYPPT